jgi:glycosyltransferase involved in cell wall biosynthesis
MKIVQFIASKGYMGAERSFVELCNALASRNEVYAMVFADCGFLDRFDEQVHLITLRSGSGRYNLRLYLEIWRNLTTLDPDIVHTHSGKATQILYRLTRFFRKEINFIATKRNLRREKVFDKVPYVAAISQNVYNQLHNPSKYLVYNGVRFDEITSVPKESVFTIVAVGALRKVKGFDLLIEAATRLRFDFRLWIVGEGEEREALEEMISRYGLEEKVQIKGYSDEVPTLLSRAHMQVVSSRKEGFARVIVEGIFYSDLLISTPAGIAPEILPDKLLSVPEKLSEKINEAYNDYPEYLQKFQKIKSKYRQRFMTGGMVKEYQKVYRSILAER